MQPRLSRWRLLQNCGETRDRTWRKASRSSRRATTSASLVRSVACELTSLREAQVALDSRVGGPGREPTHSTARLTPVDTIKAR